MVVSTFHWGGLTGHFRDYHVKNFKEEHGGGGLFSMKRPLFETEKLEIMVNHYIKDGWRPFGSPYESQMVDHPIVQAMVHD